MSEKNESRTQAIRGYVDGKIQWLWGLPENQRRAELAKLRRGIGHAPGELPDLWGSLLQGMPASFYGTNGPSHEEWAVYLALTLYALHQQSNDTVCVSQLGCTLGRAVRRLAEQTVASGQDWTESSILQCDAPQLAQLPANIRLRWGQDLYRYEKNESSETQEKEN